VATYQIAVIPGDGIGQAVIPKGLKALRELQEIVPSLQMDDEMFPWNGLILPIRKGFQFCRRARKH
jgi:isocitrate/isopropylmalate dehydrogenase